MKKVRRFVVWCAGLDVSDAIRSRITACSDVATLDRWIARAATAGSAEDVVRELKFEHIPTAFCLRVGISPVPQLKSECPKFGSRARGFRGS
jgi:hypothetical protein